MKARIGICSLGLFVAGGCALLMGCLRDDRNPSGGGTPAGAAKVVIQAGRIGALAKGAPLAKAAAIELAELEVTLSAAGETSVTETFPLSGNGPATVSHTFPGLASPKTWSLSALTRDRLGEIIHRGASSFEVRPRQTARVDLALSALFSMLRANFHPIRDSVTRVELWVDGDRRDDSAFAKQSALGDTIPLFFDYLAAGSSHVLGLRVFGEMWGLDTLLYSADTSLNVVAGEDGTHSLLLSWVGPASPPPGQATMTVSLGRVGTQVVNGHLEDTAAAGSCPSEYVLVPREALAMGPGGSGGAGLHAAYSNGEVRLGEGPIWFGPHEAGWVPSWYPADRLADDSAPALWRTISGIGGETLTGYIRGPRTGRVGFAVGSDDYMRLEIEGVISLLNDNQQWTTEGTGEMRAGVWYPITLEYRNRWGTNALSFHYRCADFE